MKRDDSRVIEVHKFKGGQRTSPVSFNKNCPRARERGNRLLNLLERHGWREGRNRVRLRPILYFNQVGSFFFFLS